MIDAKEIRRVIRWHYNASGENVPQLKDFHAHYGKVMGDHFWEKYTGVLKRDPWKMLGYFSGLGDAQTFCDIIEECTNRYEKSTKQENL